MAKFLQATPDEDEMEFDDVQVVADNQSKAIRRHRGLMRAYKETFSTPSGQKVLAHMCESSRVFNQEAPPIDTNALYYQEGERRFVMSILALINYDLGKFEQALIQNKGRKPDDEY